MNINLIIQKRKAFFIVIAFFMVITGWFLNGSKASAADEKRLLREKYEIVDLPHSRVIQAFDIYKNGSDIYLFVIQQNVNTPKLTLYRLVNGDFVKQSTISIDQGGHGDSLAVEGNHIWITGTKANVNDGTPVPVVKRLTFTLAESSGKKIINITSTKVIKNLVYNVISNSVTYNNLKRAFVAVTGTRLCIKISFQGTGMPAGDYYRVYSLADLNDALNSLSGSELSLNTASVGTSAKLATFHYSVNVNQGIDIDGGYIYGSKGGGHQLPRLLKLKYTTKTKGSAQAATIQTIGNGLSYEYDIVLYRSSSDTGNRIEAEGVQRVPIAFGPFGAGTYVMPGVYDLSDNRKAALYFVTSNKP